MVAQVDYVSYLHNGQVKRIRLPERVIMPVKMNHKSAYYAAEIKMKLVALSPFAKYRKGNKV